MSYFLLLFLFVNSAFAGLDKLQIKNLDFEYQIPYGKGEVEKVSIGINLKAQAHPVEVFRRDESFDLQSPYIDFQWQKPITFFHNLKNASTKKLNLNVDKKEHHLKGEELKFSGEKTGDFIFGKFDLACSGNSVAVKPIDRVKDDCLNKMEVSVTHMELPFKFLTEISSQLPDVATETEGNIPANDFALSVLKGDFYSHLRIKYIVKAYLKIWGHGQYENNKETFAIRVDSIKFGFMPVTTLVMLVLQNQVQHPRLKIDPPWIRIHLGNK